MGVFTALPAVRLQWSVVTIVAVVALAVGVIGTAAVLRDDRPESLASATAAASVATTTRKHADVRSVEITLESGPVRTVRAPSVGVLTSIDAAVGRTIRSGEQLASIDGRPVIALHTATPMWRDLGDGDRGQDVRALQTALRDHGATRIATDGFFGRQTRRAAWDLLGVPATERAERFPATSIAWLPSTSAVVRACPTAVGADVDRTSVLAEFPPAVSAARMTSTPAHPVPGDREIVLAGERLSISPDGVVDDLDALARFSGESTQHATGDIEGGQTITASWRLREPATVTVLPPTSVRVLDAEHGCVAVPAAEPVRVTIVGSELGQTLVTHEGRLDRVRTTPPKASACR